MDYICAILPVKFVFIASNMPSKSSKMVLNNFVFSRDLRERDLT